MVSGGADLMAMLRDSIMNLNQKFDRFNETVTGKIEKIERNYEQLSAKIDTLGSGTTNHIMASTFGAAHHANE